MVCVLVTSLQLELFGFRCKLTAGLAILMKLYLKIFNYALLLTTAGKISTQDVSVVKLKLSKIQ